MSFETRKSFSDLVHAAEAAISFKSVDEVKSLLHKDTTALIDLRVLRELDKTGVIPGATSVPRGLLEFWIDPTSPYAREIFCQPKTFVFYCDNGWRSALSTQLALDMGLQNVFCLRGGLDAWLGEAGPVEPYRW